MPPEKSKGKSIRVNYFYNLIYEVVALLTPLITTPYISRVLGASGVGVYSYTNSIANYFVLFGNLGMVTYGQMAIAKVRDDVSKVSKIFAELWLMRIITVSASLIIYFIVAFSMTEYSEPLLCTSVLVLASVFDFSWLFRGIEDFSRVVIRNLVVKLSCTILIFCLVKTADDVNIYILLVSASTLIGNITYFFSIRPVIKHLSFKNLNLVQHIKPSLIYFIPTIATSVYKWLDKFMLGFILNDTAENGFYEQAHRIEEILLTTITSLNMIMRSRMTYLFGEKKYDQIKIHLNRSLSYITMIAIPMTVGLIFIANNFIPLFLGDGFEESIILLQVFSFLIIIIGLSNCLNTHLLAPSGRQVKNNYVLISGAAFNFICNLILIPQYKALGAAIASVFAELLILCGYLFLARDFIKIGNILKLSFKYIISGACMGVCVYFVSFISVKALPLLIIQILTGIFVYMALVLILRDKFAIEALDTLRNGIKKRFVKK